MAILDHEVSRFAISGVQSNMTTFEPSSASKKETISDALTDNRHIVVQDTYEVQSSERSVTQPLRGRKFEDLKINFESMNPSCPSDTNTPLNGSPS